MALPERGSDSRQDVSRKYYYFVECQSGAGEDAACRRRGKSHGGVEHVPFSVVI